MALSKMVQNGYWKQCWISLLRRHKSCLDLSSPKAGNHHDLHEIGVALHEIFNTLEMSGIPLDRLFINADSGFDSRGFRLACVERGIFANVDFNRRHGENNEYEYLLDEELYKERYSVIKLYNKERPQKDLRKTSHEYW